MLDVQIWWEIPLALAKIELIFIGNGSIEGGGE